MEFESIQFVTLIAANGDQLTADTTVTGCGDGDTPAEPVGAYTITGGTGRFDGVTGSGDIVSVVGPIDDAGVSSLSTSWTGTISY